MAEPVYLFHPWDTLTTGVLIRAPEFSNAHALNLQVTNKHARNGERRTYKRTPTYQILTMGFTNLTRLKVLELQAFLTLSAGEDVRLFDWESKQWRGVIINNPQFVADSVGKRDEASSVTLEFEGIPIAIEP